MAEEMSKLDYQGAIDYILRFADYERLSRSAIVFDLARMKAMLERLGNPHLAVKSVHIAGTKGKGSTSAMIASMLTACGYRTGLYTSPHLLSFTERFRIDGNPISESEFAALVQRLKPEIDAFNSMGSFGELTTFEILTVVAFVCFNERRLDYQVIETGIGGRLDATNTIQPEVCAITSISLDHMELLGDTKAKIAAEKAGIIKPGTVLVCAPQSPEVIEVISSVCQAKNVPMIQAGKDITWEMKERSQSGQSFRLKGLQGTYDLTIPLLGEYQMANAAVAVGVMEVLASRGVRVTPEGITAGLSHVSWPGRLQVLCHNPLVVADGAHNADSALQLAKALPQYFHFDDIYLVIGTSSDKDIPGIVSELASLSKNVIVTKARNPRAAEASVLVAEFRKRGINPRVSDTVHSAITLALREAKPQDLICVTGSLFVVAEAIEYANRLNQS